MVLSSKNRITRRSVLRGLGSVSIALPFLEAMLLPRQSHAAGTTPTRFVVFYTPGGTLLDKWRPTGTETSFTFGDMMASLNPYNDRLMVLDGLNLSVTAKGVGHPHSRGMAGVLTGMQLLPGNFETGGGGASFADGPSVDQVIAQRIGQGTRFPSLEYSSGWSISGRSAGEQSFAADQLTMAASEKPIPPQTNCITAFNRVFGGFSTNPADNAAANAKTKSILDAVGGQYTKISAQLGSADRAKLSEHLDMIRQMEMSLTSAPSAAGAGCVVPPMPTSAGGTPTNPTQSGTGVVVTALDVPAKGKVMTDLLVASLACDLTRVGTMQWADSEAKFIMNFAPLNLPDHHHAYQHEHGFQPDALFKIYQWYATNFVYFLSKLDAVKEGDGTLLDNTLVFWISEIQMPDDHSQTNMPFILAGKAQGKLKTGRWIKIKPQPHNNLLVTLLNIFGGTDTKFGDPDFNTGALTGLT
jgi:hypothetical protein